MLITSVKEITDILKLYMYEWPPFLGTGEYIKQRLSWLADASIQQKRLLPDKESKRTHFSNCTYNAGLPTKQTSALEGQNTAVYD